MGSRVISWPWFLISAASALSRMQLPQYIGPAPAVNATIFIRRLRHPSRARGVHTSVNPAPWRSWTRSCLRVNGTRSKNSSRRPRFRWKPAVRNLPEQKGLFGSNAARSARSFASWCASTLLRSGKPEWLEARIEKFSRRNFNLVCNGLWYRNTLHLAPALVALHAGDRQRSSRDFSGGLHVQLSEDKGIDNTFLPLLAHEEADFNQVLEPQGILEVAVRVHPRPAQLATRGVNRGTQ